LAESVFAMILTFTRGIRDAISYQQNKEYAGRAIRPKLIELTDMTLGIVGLGMVGRSIAERAAAFNMNIVAVDMFPNNKPDYVSELWGLERLDEMLSLADFVVVTVPYTPDTDHMIGAEQIARLKPSAMLVGISRGKIIDEDALVDALNNDRLAAAALDVFAQEPLPADSPLWEAKNLLITPHVAGGTQYEGKYILEILYENMERFVKGNLPLRNQIDKQRGF
jgi:phosphoglycerate dehydrogenase-like enzyme